MIDRVTEDLKAAMKAGDQPRVQVLRSLKTALKNAEVEHKGSVSVEESMAAIKRQAKQRQEAADAYHKAGDSDSAGSELNEKAIIDEYLPEQMGEDEIVKVVEDVIASAGEQPNKGQIIGQVMGRLKGQADGAVVAKVVGQKLDWFWVSDCGWLWLFAPLSLALFWLGAEPRSHQCLFRAQ